MQKIMLLLGIMASLFFFSEVEARVIGGTTMEEQPMEENLCVLTFDDGPSIFTPQLLDMLKEYQIHVTFFMLGQMVNHYQDIALRAYSEGHEIASHTHSHKNLRKLSYDRQLQEIELGYDSLTALGIIPTHMRPPYGSYDERTVEIATNYGLNVVLWSVDSKDWKRLPDDYGKLYSASGALPPGEMHGVFLFHDIHKRTVDDLPRIISQLKRAGCERFVTLSEYLQGVLDPEPALLMTRHTPSNNPSIQTMQVDLVVDPKKDLTLPPSEPDISEASEADVPPLKSIALPTEASPLDNQGN
ncbi:MAG: polysaccharide deacetylase family protein [Desulfovibrionaceae bacterium]|nr:polysaccharide deacetylase family protein [Desulfovibrionaceae bacterium]